MPSPRGSTLLEIMLSLGVAAVILSALSVFFVMMLGIRAKHESLIEVDEQGTAALTVITQAIRNSVSVSSPSKGSEDASLTLSVDSPNDPTVFSVSDGVLQITEAGGDPIPLTNSHVQMTDLRFQNLGDTGGTDSILMTFTVSRVNPSGRSEYDVTRTFSAAATVRTP